MKLLTHTRNVYLVLSVIVVLIATPVFYFIINHLFIERVDETLQSRKDFILHKLSAIHTEKDIAIWQQFDDDIELLPAGNKKLAGDSVYTVDYFNQSSREYEPCRALQSEIHIQDKSHILLIRISLVESEDLIKTIVLSQIILLALLLTGLTIMTDRLSRKILKPFYDTLARLRNYQISHTEPLVFARTSVNEFNELNEAIGKMTDKIRSDYLSLKQFTENASHEIQTPLAIINSKLELMMQDKNVGISQMQALQTIFDSSNRLSRLNQGLLLLTKIENNQFNNIEKINLKELILKKINSYEDFILAKELRIELELTDKIIPMNQILAQTLIANLLTNAIKHNLHKGLLQIRLSEHQLIVANSGLIPQVSTNKYFERFYKAIPDSDSLGLGLAIIKEICEHEKFQIAYIFDKSLHQIIIFF